LNELEALVAGPIVAPERDDRRDHTIDKSVACPFGEMTASGDPRAFQFAATTAWEYEMKAA
jgi:hypothetical protein